MNKSIKTPYENYAALTTLREKEDPKEKRKFRKVRRGIRVLIAIASLWLVGLITALVLCYYDITECYAKDPLLAGCFILAGSISMLHFALRIFRNF